ncbi:alpha/beta hydrolase fold domain-containing protein [Gulosibacter chungangensis]|uniref:Alpha/beta hydrolase fold domain-containing protein n=1 Tax=Gulosibacter chungangensis TaxID=979746 RepID=A0A7J5B827_9MICO|nr:alpha/beta hydrolase fold domain-containing protein [Gulosibacter chungangensis]KAB1641182.1 alpha/beta hydrolase fold domain-containing protein [Gulosibacter chungangensis]
MTSQELNQLQEILKAGGPDFSAPTAEVRPMFEGLTQSFPVNEDFEFTERKLGGVPVLWMDGPSKNAPVLFYIHGGAYIVGSASGYRSLSGNLAEASGAAMCSVDYRLAEEHPYPAAYDDAYNAYLALLESGVDAASVIVAGDSAGGGLAIALLQRLRDEGKPQPACAFTLSAWADLSHSGSSHVTNREADISLTTAGLASAAERYLGETGADHPSVSPVFGDFEGLCPLYLTVGSEEIVLSDSVRIAEAAANANVDVTLRVLPHLPHDWPLFSFMLSEGRETIAEIGEYTKQHTQQGAQHGTQPLDVVIVGAGWSGMMSLVRMREQGRSAMVLEAAPEVGGTWYWNRYPGLRCDIESTQYCYSFDDKLVDEWNWSERFPTQAELLEYAKHVADRHELRRDIEFNTRVASMTFDEARDLWTLTAEDGRRWSARHVIMATGPLSTPKPLDIAGTEDFQGQLLSTTDWPHEPVDFTGKRVAVIGTGSSGIQVSTELAKSAAKLFVCQRTPSLSLPAFNRPLSDADRSKAKQDFAEHRERARDSIDGLGLATSGKSALEVSDEELRADYDAIYESGIPFAYLSHYTDTLFDMDANTKLRDYLGDRISQIVKDPDTAAALVPTSYPAGTRRLCLDTGFYEIFNQDNVALVDLKRNPIDRIVDSGIRLEDGSVVDVDVIVLATGYDALTGALKAINIQGVGGRQLREEWESGPQTYLGLAVHGFPNFYTIVGPQSPSVLSNMFVSIEQHVDWVAALIDDSEAAGFTRVEASARAQQEWVTHARDLGELFLHSKGDSWYVGSNVEGKPRSVLPYLGGVGPYRAKCDEVAAAGYEGFVRTR